jgi:glucose dehydrogenase
MHLKADRTIQPGAVALLIGAASAFLCLAPAAHVRAARRPSSSSAHPVIIGGQWSQDHYSHLTQIDRSNVHRLRVAWIYDTHQPGPGMETNPLVVDGVIYAYTATQQVIALDAATGKLLWKFDSGIHAGQPVRGVSYWTDGKHSFVLAGIMNYLYELDAATGRPVTAFGEQGRIDLRKGLRGDYRQQSIALTSPGVIFHDLIIVGGRNPETPPAPPGDIRAFNVRTGQLVWSFHTIPHPGEPGYSTWPPDAWKTAGAANNWAGMVVDNERGVVYVPTGSAVPDFYGGARVGDDKFADCLLALDAATGKLLWSFQGVHHDLWDRDFPAPPVLVTVRRHGKPVDAIAQTTKQGFLFVLDRDTGKPLFPVEERPVVLSTVPGEVSSPTQPFPLLPAPYARQTVTPDDLTQRTPEAHAYAKTLFETFISGNQQFTPLALGKQTIAAPGFDGGGEWGGASVDPARSVIYINTNNVVDTGGLAANDSNARLGLSTYQHQCSLCHRDNRGGSPPEFPSLIGIDHHMTDQQIIERIHNGKGRMPSFPNLQDGQLQALLKYLDAGKDESPAGSASHSGATTNTELQHDKLELPSDTPAPRPRDRAGAVAYARNCAICHGDAMEGITPGFPPLVGIGDRMSSAQIVTLIRNGKGRMPPFTEPKISDAELQHLLQFLDATDLSTNTNEDAIAAMDRYRFTGYRKFHDEDGYPAVSPPWGTLNAINLNTGKYLWTVPLGEYPELAGKGLANTGTENYGGPIVTAGGLVVIGATVFDNMVRAFDSTTGKLLWQYKLPYAAIATPTTYMVGGKQYIVIASGGGVLTHGAPDGLYVAFALP